MAVTVMPAPSASRALEIPKHRLSQPRLERLARAPAERRDLADVVRIAPVVARAVGDVADQPGMRGGAGPRFVEQRADLLHHLVVRALGLAADVVRLPGPAARQYEPQRLAMVLDV